MVLGRGEKDWWSGGNENLAEMENGGVSCVDSGLGGFQHGNEEDPMMPLDQFLEILNEEPPGNNSFDILAVRTSEGDNNAEYQDNINMPPEDFGSLNLSNNQLHDEHLLNIQLQKETDSGQASLNFQIQKEADSGSVYGLQVQDNGESSHCDFLDPSLSECLNTSAGDSFQPDDQYGTSGSSQSDLYDEFSYAGKMGTMSYIDSLRPQQRGDSVLASDFIHLPISESNNSRDVLALDSLNIGKEGKTFGSIDVNSYQQSSKLDPSNIEKSVSERGWQAPVVDLTQTDSSDEDVEIEVGQFGNTDAVRRTLPPWVQTTRKFSTNKESKVISQRNLPFADASDWNHRKAPINAQERRIVGLQFQGTSGVDSNGIFTEKKPFTGNVYQHNECRFESKQHVKEECQWSSGASSSNWKSGSMNLDPLVNQNPNMMDVKYWNNGSDTEDLHESTNNLKRHLPPTLAPVSTWPKADDERQTLRLALQDLTQPISEEIPDDGLMAVPLLKHQRIALAWMVQKETNNMNCAGGILADDQGLGKTVSTVALILKERPASQSPEDTNQVKVETSAVDLDDDDFVATDAERETRTVKESTLPVKKGRPSAGTLVVCPTSVLRQWAQEIREKVTAKANLSVLVYHGSNRTKDPNELAKYDVVLTTYSIVSMEVPKQELADDQEDFEKNPDNYGLIDSFTEKKKKKSSETTKKNNKKGVNGLSGEPSARPLAKVGWFRVVLDEAQSIKNHRTQVARACWGLRAKRRWCLSGTPIQNSIDDLYSYFRFLKYDPYASYRSFCSTIKMPISRNPVAGYRKLQAVLKTVMLRRTKGSTIDGEPIVKLPPKIVTLKKVEFSMEEREFYKRLEADSRAQFKVYAAAGTVKQNYVNILLMLLRLRQACDHPLLVKVSSSDSTWRSSAETARKLPVEKRNELICHLEGSLAICAICNDFPEVAVVTLCGHVFCNQCISAHLSQTDETVCPHQDCKSHLKGDLVFSLATLKNSTSDNQNDENFESLVKESDSNFNDPSVTSSKIRAALDTLLALQKFRIGVLKSTSVNSTDKDAGSLGNLVDDVVQDSAGEMSEEINPDLQPSRKKQVVEMPEKAIVFSQWTSMLELLEVPLKKSSIQYRRLDGTMSVLARDKAVNDFKTLPEVTVMIMSLKAASLGLNMVAACHVLLLDLWWNPTTEDQAIDRAHRIGQTRPVHVSRFTVKDTVEDRILALQERKREMVASAFGEDGSGGRHSHLSEEDLRYLFMI